MKGLVVVGTNANMAAAYDVKTGRELWKRNVNGPCGFGPLLFCDLSVVFTDSVYLLKPDDGKIVRRFSWKTDGVSEADCTRREVVCMLRGGWPPNGQSRFTPRRTKGTCRYFICASLKVSAFSLGQNLFITSRPNQRKRLFQLVCSDFAP
jgi:hypothetical protein